MPPKREESTSCWPRLGDNKFTLTSKHLTRHQLDEMKHKYDELGSAAFARLQCLSHLPGSGQPQDFFTMLCEHKDDPVLCQLWTQINEVPEWVDWGQIERGQKTFWRYGLANLIGFAMQGFMGGNAATPSIAEVLVRTGGFSTRVVLRRALETFQGLLQTTRCLNDIKPGADGHTSLVRVRLLHANVRQRMLKLCALDPEYFNIDKYGVPINTCDDIHTIALFACNPVWLELPAMGLKPRDSEIADYIAFFRYVSYVLGVPDQFFAGTAEAKRTMEAFCVLECQPDETSKILCHNFITALKDVAPVYISAGFIAAASRAINGENMSDALGIDHPKMLHVATFRGFCWLAQVFVRLQGLIQSFDEFMIETQRNVFYTYIVNGSSSEFCLGGASKFDIKHVPRLGKQTHRQAAKRWPVVWFRLEWLFLMVFLLGCSVFSLALCIVAWNVKMKFKTLHLLRL